jgi:GNAT superfamily N-acetyltransferase
MNLADNDLPLTLRKIEPRDAPDVALLIRQLGYDRPVEEVLRWIEEPHSNGHSQTAFVACVGQEVAGWIEVSIQHRLQTQPFALIGGLVVKEGMRGRGIGQRLCKCAESWCWELDAKAIRVTSRNTRVDSHRFYERDGYRRVKTSLVFEKERPT